ncbi:MAG: acetate--CoA ligase family protein, partial [Clostridia bacterium]|nr:acetate--CoA ligase family protein [Clostridia bacterium]
GALPQSHGGLRSALSEHKSKLLLQEYGIPTPQEAIVQSADEAAEAAGRIGFPVVMKIESDDILHKSDIGGVMLNIRDAAAARDAFIMLLKNAAEKQPDARINGILVQKMLPDGLEFIVGVSRDPLLGPMVLCGLGGILVELYRDVALYPAPLSKAEALGMIGSLKASRLLGGYRGRPVLDIDALANAIVDVGRLAAEQPVAEVDINPLFVYEKGHGVAAADGLVVIER